MLNIETAAKLDSTVILLCDKIQEYIKKGGGIEYLPDLINSVANLANSSKATHLETRLP